MLNADYAIEFNLALKLKLKFIAILNCMLLICINNISFAQSGTIKTNTSESWNNWIVDDGKIRTYTSEDWDHWQYTIGGESGNIKTYTSKDWDYWEVDGGKIKIKTYTSEDWDYWEGTGNGIQIKIKTYTSEDWDHWKVSGDVVASMKTYTSEDWDHWEVSGNLSGLTPPVKAAILFIPIFTSSIYIRGKVD